MEPSNLINPYTIDGHLIGMLDRDQRTTKCIDYCYNNIVFYRQNLHIIINGSNHKNDSIKLKNEQIVVCRRNRRNWKFSYIYKTLQSKYFFINYS